MTTNFKEKLSKLAVAAALGTGLAAAASGQAEASQTVKVCNYTSDNLDVAFGYHNYVVPNATGWFNVSAGTCRDVFVENADTLLPAYGIAQAGAGGKVYRPSGALSEGAFCLHPTAAFDTSLLECGFRGYVTTPLNQIVGQRWNIR